MKSEAFLSIFGAVITSTVPFKCHRGVFACAEQSLELLPSSSSKCLRVFELRVERGQLAPKLKGSRPSFELNVCVERGQLAPKLKGSTPSFRKTQTDGARQSLEETLPFSVLTELAPLEMSDMHSFKQCDGSEEDPRWPLRSIVKSTTKKVQEGVVLSPAPQRI